MESYVEVAYDVHVFELVDTYPNGVWYDPDGRRRPGRALCCTHCHVPHMFRAGDYCATRPRAQRRVIVYAWEPVVN